MKVWGLSEYDVENVLEAIGLDVDNIQTVGKAVQFRMLPHDSRGQYSRTTPNGRRVRACCYHGFRDGILALFNAGATRVHTANSGERRYVLAHWSKDGSYRVPGHEVIVPGDWTNARDFRQALGKLHSMNIGSEVEPCEMGNLCECETPSMNYIMGRVTDSFDPEALAIV